MDFSFSHALRTGIVGQKRTGKSKQFVFLMGDMVYKGPYKRTEKRFTNVLARSLIFDAWKTPCVIKALDYVETSDGIFIRFPNIMHKYSLESEPYTESFSNLNYQILKDPPVVDVLQALPTNLWIFGQVEDLLVALCHCYLLGVGDMNLRNCLVDPVKQSFYIVDIDDNRALDREDALFYFNKPPAKKNGWAERVSGHYMRVAERISILRDNPIVLDKGLVPRLEKAISLLQQYSRASPLVVAPPPVSSPIANTVPTSIVKTSSGPDGQMVWKGLRGGVTKTYSGLDFDVVKSALQKYIRRQMTQKAILAGIEMFRLGEVGGDAAVTNLFNRVAIIANEDIGPANVPLVLEVTRLVESGIRDVYTLMAMIQLLAESPKTRMMSHAWRAYATPEGRSVATSMGMPIDTAFSEEDLKYIAQNKNSELFLSTDPEAIRPYLLIFLKRLLEKDFNAYTWAYFFLEATRNLTVTKRRKFLGKSPRSVTGKADILLWKALSKVLSPETHDILVEAYFNHTESRPFLQNAILIAVSGLKSYTKFDINPMVDAWKNGPIVEQMLNGMYPLVITEEEQQFIVDKHTAAGKKQGRTVKQFVEEGALVIPQDPQFYNETLATIYKSREI